jgi:hypothetical protein
VNYFADLICRLRSHKYVVTQKLSYASRRLCCTRCNQLFGMNDNARALLKWDSDLIRMYESFGVPIIYKDIELKALKN